MTDSQQRENPYVGPRAFDRGDRLYGRDHELRRLLNLLIAERIVLLYSPSGAGKTSLIQASLVPKLEEEGFRIWPSMRVNQELSPSEIPRTSANRYVLSLLLSLEADLAEADQTPVDQLAGMTLDAYLNARTNAAERSFDDLFVFDQFEEVLTLDPTDRDVKLEFFEQLGEMLRNRRRWALFAMREEFIAGLDPFVRPIPSRFSATFRLELLSPGPAKQAMQRPARAAGVDFTDGAANKLVDDLRTVRVLQADGTMGNRPGLYVEPVQLQVVCRHLWDRLPAGATQIVETDLQAVGDVDRALADFYAAQVAVIAAETDLPERTVREWIDRQLITEQGIRGQVLQGHDQSRGLDNRVIWRLVDVHLVRPEERRGATWFELAHDRLIGPVRGDNAAWRQSHLSPVQQQALLWKDEDQPDDLLLRGPELLEAERWAAEHERDLTDVERHFLAACRANLSSLERQAMEWESRGRPNHLLLREEVLVEAESRAETPPAELTRIERVFLSSSQEARVVAERQRRQARWIRWLALVATAVSIVAIGFAVIASYQTQAARSAARAEAVARETAEIAGTAEATAREGAEDAAAAEAAALEMAVAAVTRAVAAQQTAEMDRILAVTSLANAEAGLSAASNALASSQERAATIQALEATNQALATQLTPTPSATPIPSGTPTSEGGTPHPSATPTRTATPSATPTPTPDQSATAAVEAATAQAIQENLAQVWATQTAVAGCSFEPQGEFSQIWKPDKIRLRLGCPKQSYPTRGYWAEQPFQYGHMYWSQSPDLYVVMIGRDAGKWYLFRTEEITWTWNPSGVSCPADPPDGVEQPVRGFGGLWCANPQIQKEIGFATQKEQGTNGDLLQEFDRGYIFRDSEASTYILFGDNSTYVRDMVFIPGGQLLIGGQLQQVSDFWLDRYEVTNAEYKECVEARVCAHPHREGDSPGEDGPPEVISASRGDYYTNPKFDQFPVIFVDWGDAHNYCTWLHKELPTEAEWEWAAKGLKNYLYPWGDKPEPSIALANYNKNVGDTSKVGRYPPSSLGLYDMAGNVWEWTSSLRDGGEDPHAIGERVIRGGSWRDAENNLRSANRNFRRPNGPLDNIGFRCAMSIQEP